MARWDKLRKLERNAWLAQYIKEHPDLSMAEVGQFFGISRQRVYQILDAAKKRGR